MEITPEQAIDLCKGDFGKESLKQIAHYVAPIFWVVREEHDRIRFRNGSMFFVDAGDGIFAVTANHVYEKYLKDRDDLEVSQCRIMPDNFGPSGLPTVKFPLHDRLIDNDPDSDIATFEVQPAEMTEIRSTVLTTWPPMVPQEGLGIGLAGFPAQERHIHSLKDISFSPFPVLGIATSVNEQRITVQFEEEFVVRTPGFKTAPQGYSTAGMSGGPLLTYVNKNGLFFWCLGGVITEGHNEFGLLFASRADHLNSDGTILR